MGNQKNIQRFSFLLNPGLSIAIVTKNLARILSKKLFQIMSTILISLRCKNLVNLNQIIIWHMLSQSCLQSALSEEARKLHFTREITPLFFREWWIKRSPHLPFLATALKPYHDHTEKIVNLHLAGGQQKCLKKTVWMLPGKQLIYDCGLLLQNAYETKDSGIFIWGGSWALVVSLTGFYLLGVCQSTLVQFEKRQEKLSISYVFTSLPHVVKLTGN